MRRVVSRNIKSPFFGHQELLRESSERLAAEQEEHRASLNRALEEQEVRWLHLDISCTGRALTVAPMPPKEQAQMKIRQLRAQRAELTARLEAQGQEMDT